MHDPAAGRHHQIADDPGRGEGGGFLAGRPEDIVEQLKAVEKRYPGLDRVICATPLGTPLSVQLENLDRFAAEVIPAFRGARAAAQ
jgi:alkanesulfonate monooxygenase SsuD/methylene tetrahydromethanopterin reductase-like flavin-dependent oxidoreductase (luciferase family)